MSVVKQPLIVGRFGKTFGVQGWIKLQSFTTPTDNILKYQPWYIKKRRGWQILEITGSDFKGETIIIKLPGCNDPETAKRYTNCQIAVDRSQLPEIDENEHYWADLIGMSVVTTKGIKLGIVNSLLETGANDVLVIKGKEEFLLPYVKEIIKNINKNTKTITVEWAI